MKWLTSTGRRHGRYLRLEKMKAWHEWFAWYPVKISQYKMCWMEKCYRCYKGEDYNGKQQWEHKDLIEALKGEYKDN